jgi:hypothetical protein
MNITLPLSRFVNTYQFDNPLFDSALIEAIRADGGIQSYTTNVQAYMTEYKLQLNHQAEPFDKFFTFLNDSIGASLREQIDGRRDFDTEQQHYQYVISDIWGAIYKHNDYCRLHQHLGSPVSMGCLSFVYYAQSNDSSTAPLVFPGIEYSITPVTGQLVIFPGWLSHFVPAYKPADGLERIVLAGNVAVKWKTNKDN